MPAVVKETVMVALLLALTGCGGDGSSGADAPPTEPADPISGAPATTPGIRGDTVEVRMGEYFYGFPTLMLPAGPVIFELHNVGNEWHTFVVQQGDSVVFATERDVDPTEVRPVEMTLGPGEYEVHCTISGHELRGMVETLTIVAAPDG